MAISAERNIKAQRGGELRCKGWRQESILRMLENNLENAERPEELIVYAGSAKAARDWESFDRIVEALKTMEEEQTLVVQSGKPIGLFTTHRLSPIAVIANGNVVGRWAQHGRLAGADRRRALDLRRHDGGRLAVHRLAGDPAGHLRDVHGGRAQALRRLALRPARADRRASAAWAAPSRSPACWPAPPTLVVEVDPERVDRRLREGYLQHRSDDLDEALALRARREGAGARRSRSASWPTSPT